MIALDNGFTFVPNRTWDDDPPTAPLIDFRDDGKLFVHHSVSGYLGQVVPYATARARAAQIDHFHSTGNYGGITGGLGYTALLVGKFIFEGRGERRGAHTVGYNSTHPALCVDGNFQVSSVTAQVEEGIAAYCRAFNRLYGDGNRTVLLGHRQVNPTGCPGDKLYARLPSLQASLQNAVLQRGWWAEAENWVDGGIGPAVFGGWARKGVYGSIRHEGSGREGILWEMEHGWKDVVLERKGLPNPTGIALVGMSMIQRGGRFRRIAGEGEGMRAEAPYGFQVVGPNGTTGYPIWRLKDSDGNPATTQAEADAGFRRLQAQYPSIPLRRFSGMNRSNSIYIR